MSGTSAHGGLAAGEPRTPPPGDAITLSAQASGPHRGTPGNNPPRQPRSIPIVTDHFVALADPKKNFAAQNVLPLVYKPAMTPQITSTLNAISAALTTNALLQMDTALDVQHASYSQVAAGFLKAVHLG
ncbi:MAG TPA: glycine betaine ABC transporter substrate-binding protein [Streptosporangiaceae bacterium]